MASRQRNTSFLFWLVVLFVDKKLTIFALALLDEVFIFDIFMAGFAIKPGPVKTMDNKKLRLLSFIIIVGFLLLIHYIIYLLTSSADWAMKNPTVFDGNLVPLGLMEILLSFPSSHLTSIANRRSFNLTKQSLEEEESIIKYWFKNNSIINVVDNYSEAWENVIPVNVGDNVSVYISHPVPCK